MRSNRCAEGSPCFGRLHLQWPPACQHGVRKRCRLHGQSQWSVWTPETETSSVRNMWNLTRAYLPTGHRGTTPCPSTKCNCRILQKPNSGTAKDFRLETELTSNTPQITALNLKTVETVTHFDWLNITKLQTTYGLLIAIAYITSDRCL